LPLIARLPTSTAFQAATGADFQILRGGRRRGLGAAYFVDITAVGTGINTHKKNSII